MKQVKRICGNCSHYRYTESYEDNYCDIDENDVGTQGKACESFKIAIHIYKAEVERLERGLAEVKETKALCLCHICKHARPCTPKTCSSCKDGSNFEFPNWKDKK